MPLPLSPFGATVEDRGVMFRVFSRHAGRVWLLLFDRPEDTKPVAELEFDPAGFRSGDIWHMFVEGLKPGQLYLYRMDGPYEPEKGHLFSSDQWLIDPFAKAITGVDSWGNLKAKEKLLREKGKNADIYRKLEFAGLAKCVVEIASLLFPDDRVISYTRTASPPIKLSRKLLKKRPE
ncbi:hypothetical protein ACFL6L_04560 [candidate division KSB1 bacterium]